MAEVGTDPNSVNVLDPACDWDKGIPSLVGMENAKGIIEMPMRVEPTDEEFSLAVLDAVDANRWDIVTNEDPKALGGPGSGNYGHVGRPGEVGGSGGGAGRDVSRTDQETSSGKFTAKGLIKAGIKMGKTPAQIIEYVKGKLPNSKVNLHAIQVYSWQLQKEAAAVLAGEIVPVGESPVIEKDLPTPVPIMPAWYPPYATSPEEIMKAGFEANASTVDIGLAVAKIFPNYDAAKFDSYMAQLDKKNAWVPDNPKSAAQIFREGIKANVAPGELIAKVKELFPDSKADMRHYKYYLKSMNEEKAAKLTGEAASPEVGADSKVNVPDVQAFPNAAPFPTDLTGLSYVKELGGSTHAKLTKDADGNLWVMKKGVSVEHIRSEVAADDTYRAAGIAVPPSKLYNGDTKLAAFIEGQTLFEFSQTASPSEMDQMKKQIADGFYMDALMANLDVVGTNPATGGMDNILVDKEGRAWRIDNGGSLQFGGAGGKNKTFNEYPKEFWTMRDSKIMRKETAELFHSSVAWYDQSARMAKMNIDGIAKAIPEGAARDIFTARARTMQQIAHSSLDYQHSAYIQPHADEIAMHRVGLRSQKLIESLPNKLEGSDYTDAKGDNGDGLVSLGHGATHAEQAAGPKEVQAHGVEQIEKMHNSIVLAAKTVNYHAADKAYNKNKIEKLKEVSAEASNLVSDPSASKGVHQAASQLLTHIAEIESAIAGGTTTGMIPTVDAVWSEVGGKPAPKIIEPVTSPAPKEPAHTPFNILVKEFARLGLDYDTASHWQSAWAGSSHTASSIPFKQWVAKQRGGLSEYVWPKGGSAGTELSALEQKMGGAEKLDKAMRLKAAYMQEFLETTNLMNQDRSRRAMFIIRTEDSGIKNNKFQKFIDSPPGTQGDYPRMAAAAGSHISRTTVSGNRVTLQAVPFVDIHSSLLNPSATTKSQGFAGWGENEWIHTFANALSTRGVDTKLLYDVGKDATKWNVSLKHLRS